MAKRGRKPSQDRKGYFYEREEEAFVKYMQCEDEIEKNKIFNEYLLPAFTKMIESIIRRYKLYPPDEEFQETFDDTISFLISKFDKFDPSSGYKAYSYCGTVCKNYLIYKINQFAKNQKRSESYDNMFYELSNDSKYSYDQYSNLSDSLTTLIKETSEGINEMIENSDKYKLKENEIKVGKALVDLMLNWEEIFERMGSNKFNKSSILLFLKESTMLNTNEIRNSMRVFKNKYYLLKKESFS